MSLSASVMRFAIIVTLAMAASCSEPATTPATNPPTDRGAATHAPENGTGSRTFGRFATRLVALKLDDGAPLSDEIRIELACADCEASNFKVADDRVWSRSEASAELQRPENKLAFTDVDQWKCADERAGRTCCEGGMGASICAEAGAVVSVSVPRTLESLRADFEGPTEALARQLAEAMADGKSANIMALVTGASQLVDCAGKSRSDRFDLSECVSKPLDAEALEVVLRLDEACGDNCLVAPELYRCDGDGCCKPVTVVLGGSLDRSIGQICITDGALRSVAVF